MFLFQAGIKNTLSAFQRIIAELLHYVFLTVVQGLKCIEIA